MTGREEPLVAMLSAEALYQTHIEGDGAAERRGVGGRETGDHSRCCHVSLVYDDQLNVPTRHDAVRKCEPKQETQNECHGRSNVTVRNWHGRNRQVHMRGTDKVYIAAGQERSLFFVDTTLHLTQTSSACGFECSGAHS